MEEPPSAAARKLEIKVRGHSQKVPVLVLRPCLPHLPSSTITHPRRTTAANAIEPPMLFPDSSG
eukprot:766462-Hanusia_phi.AAC.11